MNDVDIVKIYPDTVHRIYASDGRHYQRTSHGGWTVRDLYDLCWQNIPDKELENKLEDAYNRIMRTNFDNNFHYDDLK